RAAAYIAAQRTDEPIPAERFTELAGPVTNAALALLAGATDRAADGADNTDALLREATELMSRNAAVVRSRASIDEALDRTVEWLQGYHDSTAADRHSRRSVNRLFLIRDIITSQYVYL